MNTNDGEVLKRAAGTSDGWERREPSRDGTAPGGPGRAANQRRQLLSQEVDVVTFQPRRVMGVASCRNGRK